MYAVTNHERGCCMSLQGDAGVFVSERVSETFFESELFCVCSKPSRHFLCDNVGECRNNTEKTANCDQLCFLFHSFLLV